MEKLLYSARSKTEPNVIVSWWKGGVCRRHGLITTNHVVSGIPLATVPVTTIIPSQDWNEEEFEEKVYAEQDVYLDERGNIHVS